MPYRRADADYLRTKARQFRQLAADSGMKFTTQLLELAAELEAKANEIEARPDPRQSGSA